MTSRTRATLNTNADTTVQDNTTKDITPAEVRAMLKDLADSAYNLNDESDLTDLIAKWIPASAAGPASLDFAEDTDNGTNRVRLSAPAAIAADVTVELPGTAGTLATLAGTETLSAKTMTDPAIDGAIKEEEFAITDAAGFQIDPSNGTLQRVTLGASRTPAATNFVNGESVTLRIADGTAYTITWTTVAVTWVGGAAPTLATTGWTVIVLWKDNGVIYGKHVGDVA